MSEFTIKKAKAVEIEAARRMTIHLTWDNFKPAYYDYSHYDLEGSSCWDDDEMHTIVEVKERRSNKWPTWYIEKQKMDSMLKTDVDFRYLCIVCNNVYTVYNINDIIKCKTIHKSMNKTTAEGFDRQVEKVIKEVYEFPKKLKHFVI